MANDKAEKLRAAIAKSGISGNELAKRTGVPQITISNFLLGGDMRLKNAIKLANYLRLALAAGRKTLTRSDIERLVNEYDGPPVVFFREITVGPITRVTVPTRARTTKAKLPAEAKATWG
jgi:transcriptional regulator with XRE-family HTH domain